jgi:hypothetical protein
MDEATIRRKIQEKLARGALPIYAEPVWSKNSKPA